MLTLATSAPHTHCTAQSALQRKEWSALSGNERIAYTDAITCLMSKPSIYEPGLVPGSTSYYTDFAAGHANISLSIHQSGTFLSWHREFLHLLESALHDECDYPAQMGLPYWDWPLYTDKPLTESTLFDGSPTSLGGNGVATQGRLEQILSELEAAMLNYEIPAGGSIPPGSGGSCVVTGPFGNTIVSLGPFPASYIETGLPDNWKEANPHCLTRDLNDWTLSRFNNASRVESLLSATDIENFQYQLNPIHRGGHISVGGQMADFFVSPLEPAFFLHHAQIDRLWSLWQGAEEGRRETYNGTSTFQNPPGGTPEVHGGTVISFVPVGESITLDEAKDPMGGRYCYRYV
ncbi:hypothetical protein CNMCM5793_002467 [Aspergillus hiratsukae]|uniref:Tyrosinase copper-binding domain-containing protein n=1 Tax=Aspergillus hiratsukae TaxID=1194566 RepID=A0A8H6P259_9EURO|nr:hypothetical protein CNMCM5793_002467 [Aspergillus hiratsukae]